MPTHRRTWQKTEDRAARFFGAKRRVLSGSANRGDIGGDDASHPTLFIESKLRASSAVRTLHDAVRKRAMKEGNKTPVVCLFGKHRPGFLLCIHSDDLAIVLAEFAAALPDEQRSRLVGLIRTARARQGDGETV
jgi:hypothetical protein